MWAHYQYGVPEVTKFLTETQNVVHDIMFDGRDIRLMTIKRAIKLEVKSRRLN
jgi:hypothetical protein